MRSFFLITLLLLATTTRAQKITYSISAPPGGGLSPESLPSTIDTTHYYTSKEIRDLPEPSSGWRSFYSNLDTLEYPESAKKQKLQSLFTVAYRIDEKGTVDSVYIKSYTKVGKWERCAACEKQIKQYFSQNQWNPGTINNTPIKSEGNLLVKYSIYDPSIKEEENYFWR